MTSADPCDCRGRGERGGVVGGEREDDVLEEHGQGVVGVGLGQVELGSESDNP